MRAAVALSLAGGALGTLALVAAKPLPLVVAGGLLVGIAAGIPFAPAFLGAAQLRPDSPVAAVGMVNAAASAVVVGGNSPAWLELFTTRIRAHRLRHRRRSLAGIAGRGTLCP